MHVDEFNFVYTAFIKRVWDFIYTCPGKIFCFLKIKVSSYPDLVKYIDENKFVKKLKILKI